MKFQLKDNALLLQIKVVPNSSRTQIAGLLGDALKIKVAAPPEAGRANDAVIKLLADILSLSQSNITITKGHTNPQKTLRLQGITKERATQLLTNQLPAKK